VSEVIGVLGWQVTPAAATVPLWALASLLAFGGLGVVTTAQKYLVPLVVGAIANVSRRDPRKAKVTAEIMKEAKEIVSKKLRKLSQERNAQGGFTKEYRVYNHLKNQVDSSYIEAINRIFADSSSTFPFHYCFSFNF
jgi:hypothetical protein